MKTTPRIGDWVLVPSSDELQTASDTITVGRSVLAQVTEILYPNLIEVDGGGFGNTWHIDWIEPSDPFDHWVREVREKAAKR